MLLVHRGYHAPLTIVPAKGSRVSGESGLYRDFLNPRDSSILIVVHILYLVRELTFLYRVRHCKHGQMRHRRHALVYRISVVGSKARHRKKQCQSDLIGSYMLDVGPRHCDYWCHLVLSLYV
jgi:hypothetical protein